MGYQVQFYITEAGKCQIIEFLDSLTGKQAQKVTWVLKLIEDLDRVPVKYLKKLVNTYQIWEVRVDLGRETARLLGFFENNCFFVLAHGFKKKTQKTPRQAIVLAEKRRRAYLRRKNNE